MTSGNLRDEPIAYEDDDARERLAGFADAILLHDRPIHMRCDDSVTADFRGGPCLLRRSRGYAPVPIGLPVTTPPLLAVGGEYKNTFCHARGERAFVSHFIGEMASLEANRCFGRAVTHYENLFRITPEVIVHDPHPEYQSTRYAWQRAKEEGLPRLEVQHHHAHLAAVMADRALPLDRRVIGVAFDGTGFGSDGAIWGGEFLIAGYESFTRAFHLIYTPLAGGDAAIRNPCRVALGWLRQTELAWSEDLAPVQAAAGEELRILAGMFDSGINTVPTSSMGRLFDAAAALAGVRQRIAYEAQAAIEFEALADRGAEGSYSYAIQPGETPTARFGVVNPVPVIEEIVEDLRTGTGPEVIATRFHRGTAAMVADVCDLLRDETGLEEVALSGGVWQNLLLLELTVALLEERGFTAHLHRRVPSNDGGLSLGQAAVAAARMAADPG
jgi:hydrogenase maturation protein HypF